MGPWGPGARVEPEKVYIVARIEWDDHCDNDCCTDHDTCRCDCSWCDCRYAERMGS